MPRPLPLRLAPLLSLLLTLPTLATTLFDGADQPWSAHPADGVEQSLAYETTATGDTRLRVDVNFAAGSGYAVTRIPFDPPLELPGHFTLSFDLEGDIPPNTLEVKLLDTSYENVWWVNRRNINFPTTSQTIRLKRRHFSFAWGPAGSEKIHDQLGAIEIVVTASTGGKGTIWIDNLKLEATPPPATGPLKLIASSRTALTPERRTPSVVADPTQLNLLTTPGDQHTINLDLSEPREFSAILLNWHDQRFPTQYTLETSRDANTWQTLATTEQGNGETDAFLAPESEARHLRITTNATHRAAGVNLAAIQLLPVEAAHPANTLLKAYAAKQPRGHWPMTLENRQVFWNVAGNPASNHEALISEHGVIEPDIGSFTLEPFIHRNNNLLTWADATHTQSLARDHLPISTVKRHHTDMQLDITPLAEVIDGQELLLTRYRWHNLSNQTIDATLAIAIRPFQVLPPWQTLNLDGGHSPIHTIETRPQQNTLLINHTTPVIAINDPDKLATANLTAGDASEWIAADTYPANTAAHDDQGFTSAAMTFKRSLLPDAHTDIIIATPLGPPTRMPDASAIKLALAEQPFDKRLEAHAAAWQTLLGPPMFEVAHPSAKLILDSLNAQLAYILINMDGVRIQPGSRTYQRSWIRDGALTGKALINMGQANAVADYFAWYAPYQYDNGKVPCVVDHRGPDPVDEHDSTGQLIYLARLLLEHTHDEDFAREHYHHIRAGVAYMENLRNQRLTPQYIGTAYEGLVPESISHEGYSEKPMHSYWDNVFVVRGFDDAAAIARQLGFHDDANHFQQLADDHKAALVRSIEMAAKEQGINFIPGCVELGDFDPPSTAIAISIGELTKDLPQQLLANTFERYWNDFALRISDDRDWFDYTPYELRVITTMLRTGHRQRAHAMFDWLAQDQLPAGWLHWAEIAYRDDRAPRFIGDMPHTWVGAGFVNAARAIFVTEDEPNNTLLLGLGLKPEWLDAPGVRVHNAPTRYGHIAYNLVRQGDTLHFSAAGDATPPNGFKLILPDLSGHGEQTITFPSLPHQTTIPIASQRR
ncbi:MAG: discoidin domain-containing protein [Phycisphaeraceae bacterium]